MPYPLLVVASSRKSLGIRFKWVIDAAKPVLCLELVVEIGAILSNTGTGGVANSYYCSARTFTSL